MQCKFSIQYTSTKNCMLLYVPSKNYRGHDLKGQSKASLCVNSSHSVEPSQLVWHMIHTLLKKGHYQWKQEALSVWLQDCDSQPSWALFIDSPLSIHHSKEPGRIGWLIHPHWMLRPVTGQVRSEEINNQSVNLFSPPPPTGNHRHGESSSGSLRHSLLIDRQRLHSHHSPRQKPLTLVQSAAGLKMFRHHTGIYLWLSFIPLIFDVQTRVKCALLHKMRSYLTDSGFSNQMMDDGWCWAGHSPFWAIL